MSRRACPRENGGLPERDGALPWPSGGPAPAPSTGREIPPLPYPHTPISHFLTCVDIDLSLRLCNRPGYPRKPLTRLTPGSEPAVENGLVRPVGPGQSSTTSRLSTRQRTCRLPSWTSQTKNGKAGWAGRLEMVPFRRSSPSCGCNEVKMSPGPGWKECGKTTPETTLTTLASWSLPLGARLK